MSIKKKFATAVATAGLLAGLFGSAFVPTVSAVRGDLDAPKVALTKFNAEADDTWNAYGDSHKKGGVAKIGFYAGFDSADNDLSLGFAINDSDDHQIETANLKAVSSNSAIQVAFAYETGGGFKVDCEDSDIEDAYGATDEVEDAEGAVAYRSDSAVSGGWYHLCFYAKRAGTSTVTITANGVALRPVSIMALGDLATLTLSANYGTTRVAADNQGISRFFTLVGKDSAGQVINDGNRSLATDWTLEDWTGNSLEALGNDAGEEVENAQGEAIEMANRNGIVYTNATQTTHIYNAAALKHDTCQSESFAGAGDGDAGKKYKLGFEMFENSDDDVIQSNTVEITCTGNKDEFTVSSPVLEYTSGAADWAASSAAEDDDDGVIGIYVTVKDADGQVMGINTRPSHNGDSQWDPTLGFGIDLDDFGGLNVDDVEPRVGADGKVMIGYIVPDVTGAVGTQYPLDVTLSDWDANYAGTATLADLKKSLTYTVGSSTATVYSAAKAWSKAHTKVVVSVAWGAACSNALVTFDIEKGNGDMILVPIRRRANAAGTATLVLEKRRTVNYVTAISCTALGSTEVGPVRARFK